ncbi:acetoacetate decarboxylase family protein [Ferrovibrio sp.]|uniref:acetoacetate decarboxylase family protein n=1 Tax=Ferrovibrio sp. TaxID=1917215 RepID=UPI0035B07EB3
MAYTYEPGRMYRMPPHFGPAPGPRQNLESYTPDHSKYPKRHTAQVNYLTRKDQLEAIIPQGFSVWGDPIVQIETTYMTQIEWLAGRGYAISGLKAPLRYEGKKRTIHGLFQLVLWENLTDPILTGREDVGAPKLYAEIPEPRVFQGRNHYECSWLGNRFFEMHLEDLKEAPTKLPPLVIDGVPSDGVIYYKYQPRTYVSGRPDVEYATLSPAVGSQASIDQHFVGKGAARFLSKTFEEVPTMYHIINKLAALDLLEIRGASLTLAHGGRDFADTQIVE